MEAIGHREVLPQPTRDPALHFLFFLGRARHQHAHTGEDEERTEHQEDPVVARHKLRTHADHRPTHHERAEDAPEQHAMLVHQRHLEVLEDQRDHEDVVHRETHLDDVAREELHRGQAAIVLQAVDRVGREAEAQPVRVVREVHEAGERDRHDHRARGEEQCLAQRRRMRLAIEHAEVERQHDRDEQQESRPGPDHLVRSVSTHDFHSDSASPRVNLPPKRVSGCTSNIGSATSVLIHFSSESRAAPSPSS